MNYARAMSPIVLLVPAAGSARRLGDLAAGSKEVIEIEGLPVAAHLLEAGRAAGIHDILVLVRPGKDDVRKKLGGGADSQAPRFVTIAPTRSVPETLSRGLEHLRPDDDVALGFPDVLFTPADALNHLARSFDGSPACDVLLGIFPTDRPDKADMVELAPDGRVRRILVKPGGCDLQHTWLLALWRPRFSRFLEDWVRRHAGPSDREPQVSDALNAAIDSGLIVEAVAFPSGSHLDIGTPEDLNRARSRPLPPAR
jgi:glucose-1-phosphate thymidylyltransferase